LALWSITFARQADLHFFWFYVIGIKLLVIGTVFFCEELATPSTVSANKEIEVRVVSPRRACGAGGRNWQSGVIQLPVKSLVLTLVRPASQRFLPPSRQRLSIRREAGHCKSRSGTKRANP
jgi:hypothetical protein